MKVVIERCNIIKLYQTEKGVYLNVVTSSSEFKFFTAVTTAAAVEKQTLILVKITATVTGSLFDRQQLLTITDMQIVVLQPAA